MAVAGAPPQAPDGVATIGPPPSTAAAGRPDRSTSHITALSTSGRALLAPWRVAIYDRAARLQAALDRLPTAKSTPEYQTVVACIADALTAARFLPLRVSFAGHLRSALTGWMSSGNQADRGWMAIHRGEEAMLMITDVATLRAEALRMFPAAFKLGSPDPMSLVYLELVGRLVAPLKLPGSLFQHPLAGTDDGAVAPRGGTAGPAPVPIDAGVVTPPQRGGTVPW